MKWFRDLEKLIPPYTPRGVSGSSSLSYDRGTGNHIPPHPVGGSAELVGNRSEPLADDLLQTKIIRDLVRQNDEALILDLILYGQAYIDARTGLRIDPRNIVVKNLTTTVHDA